jgi:hypothetical protein
MTEMRMLNPLKVQAGATSDRGRLKVPPILDTIVTPAARGNSFCAPCRQESMATFGAVALADGTESMLGALGQILISNGKGGRFEQCRVLLDRRPFRAGFDLQRLDRQVGPVGLPHGPAGGGDFTSPLVEQDQDLHVVSPKGVQESLQRRLITLDYKRCTVGRQAKP